MWTIPESLVINSNNDKFKIYNLNFIIRGSASSQQTNCPTSSTETHGFHEFHWHPEPTHRKSNVSLLQDGTLVWYKEEKEQYFYPRDRFCISDLPVLGAMFPMTIYKLWSMTRFGAPDDFAWPAVYFIFLAYFALATLILDLCWRVNPSNRKEGEWFRIPVCGVLLVVAPIVILADVVSSSQIGRGDEGFCFTVLRLFHAPHLTELVELWSLSVY
ncbi:unnamed protein product [Orchesella dallaii]|uniref:Uncharacterized protein n=1 Tax=Orchesella dallaii TaxID=48710 RepID=A0ABP1RQJ1_9HEXA